MTLNIHHTCMTEIDEGHENFCLCSYTYYIHEQMTLKHNRQTDIT